MPPLGWSSWVALGPEEASAAAQPPEFDFCDESSVKASIDAFHEVGLYEAGYRHFHLDDCWADRSRNASGFLQADRGHFPRGMKELVQYAHSRGLTYGLYTCGGTWTCVGKRPGSRDHWDKDAATFAEWGVDVVKMDWCNHDDMDPVVAYRNMSDALNRTGRHIHLNMCEWGQKEPWRWGPSIAQSWRATQDHVASWDSTKDIIAQRTAIPARHGGAPFAWNDMDMLQTGNYRQAARSNGVAADMSAAEYKSEFSMWAILASPLVVTTPILNCSSTDQINGNFTPSSCRPSITPLQKEILLNTEVLAINQDVTPAGRLLHSAGQRENSTMVYARNLSDGSVAVAFYNPGDSASPGAVPFPELGWASGVAASVRDLWLREDVGVDTGRFPETGFLHVQAHGTLLFRLTPKKASLDSVYVI
ncbi:unnamed protein product [Prorocentrum cordatum]|uniref:Alpha-galactosidase n=1 Tax=Prorocentrum cordatum TaxID=2364126 RepID=A0ABN9TI14_9DINO|nr:unnamed protein product [Polarella glacialis]